MVKKGYTPEQIINKLREVELQLQQGATIGVVSKTIGVISHIYYRWHKQYSGLRVDMTCDIHISCDIIHHNLKRRKWHILLGVELR